MRAEFVSQMATVTIGGTPAGQLVGCVYALLDTDGIPLYVGQSVSSGTERLGTRISRHVLGQRSDAANKVFPPFEARVVRIWPMRTPSGLTTAVSAAERAAVGAAEKHVLWTLSQMPFPPLNERVPATAPPPVVLPTPTDIDYWPAGSVAQLQDVDGRIDRWAESIRRLADRVKHSGQTAGLRRVQRLQAARLQALL